MEYPIFDLPLAGGPLLIALVAIPHVFIAQFSIGAAFFVALSERRANRGGDRDMLAFLRKYSYLILLVPYVFGTLTGVGIWIAISLVSPRLTSLLIHQFVWGWASEWCVFIIEVTAIYLYFYTWDRLKPAAHNAIAWVFAAASWTTLPIINGIISFMLTPGGWRAGEAGSFWPAFFNPQWLPTTIVRTLMALAFAGAGAILLAAFARGVPQAVRDKVSRLAYWMILPVWLCIPLGVWTFSVLPDRSRGFLVGNGAVMQIFFGFGAALFLSLAASAAIGMRRKDYAASPAWAALVCMAAFVAYGSFEFVREGIRKPFVVEGFMYSTGVTVPGAAGVDPRANFDRTRQAGILSAAPWALPEGKRPEDLAPADRGRAVYKAACAPCHTLDGYNAMRPMVSGWTREGLECLMRNMHLQRPMMPPFPGTQGESDALVAYLESLSEKGAP